MGLAGVKTLLLLVDDGDDGNSYDHADWAEATIEAAAGAKIAAVTPPHEDPLVLTPVAGPEPHLRGARVTGVRPGHPFLFGIPATGERPLSFSAEGLPAGLALDAASGRISGTLAQKGEYRVILTAKNARGSDERVLRIVCGDQIALTPPMGWNSWNCFASAVDDAKVRAAADAMVASGLAQPRLDVHQHRRLLGSGPRRRRATSSPTRSSPT